MKSLVHGAAALLLGCFVLHAEENWPQFRGPRGDGSTTAKGLPLKWAEGTNVKWKTPLHGKAWSSPVVWGNQIWLTTATKDGKQLSVLTVNRDTGAIERDEKIFDVEAPQFCHAFNSYASPTPVIEEGRVYLTWGSPGTAAIDTKTGKKLWERRDLECNHFRGAGSSPILHGNLLIMNYDGSDFQYVVALDKDTGKTVWKTDRSVDFQDLKDGKPEADGDYRKAFSTPRIFSIDGKETLVSLGSKALYGYEPSTGKELWRHEDRRNHSGSATPIFAEGLIFSPMGFSKGLMLAVKPGGELAWQTSRNAPNKPSPIAHEGLLYIIDDGGIASCLDAKTGTEVWRERVGGNTSSAPILADGRIYFFNEEGKATVIATGREYKILAENTMGDGFMATPAVAGKALFLRSRTHLYRVEE